MPAYYAVLFLLLGTRPELPTRGLELVSLLSRVRLYQRQEHGLPELNDLAGPSTSVHEGSLMQLSMMLLKIRLLRLHGSEVVWLAVLRPIAPETNV